MLNKNAIADFRELEEHEIRFVSGGNLVGVAAGVVAVAVAAKAGLEIISIGKEIGKAIYYLTHP